MSFHDFRAENFFFSISQIFTLKLEGRPKYEREVTFIKKKNLNIFSTVLKMHKTNLMREQAYFLPYLFI